MSCLIDRNNKGKIVSVRTPEGQPSQLFQAIHSNIFMGDAESSVKLLSAAYSPQIEEKFADGVNTYSTGEPKLYLKSSKGTEFDNLEEMIISEELGSTSIGFKDPQTNEFLPIAKFDTKSSEKNKFLVDQVQQGILSVERVLQEDGITRFQGKGEYPQVRKVMAQAAKYEAAVELGNGRTKVNKDGTFEIEFVHNAVIVEHKDGQKVIEIKDVPKTLEDAAVQNKAELLVQYAVAQQNQTIPNESATDKETKPLLDSLYSFLNSMGFTHSTLEEYRKNYNTKYGKDPDILAISDMANRVVALAEGVDVTQEMTEEIAHIAIESYAEQSSIVAALATVHLTPEYKEHAAFYTEKYAAFSEGLELEDKVRKEILGKVLARQIKERFTTENKSAEELTLIDKLKDIFLKFIQSIRSVFKPHHAQYLNKITNKIADGILRQDMNLFDKAFESDNFYYSAMDQEGKKVENMLVGMRTVLEDMFTTALGQKAPRQGELERISDEMTDAQILSSVNTITNITKTQVGVLAANVKASNSSELPVAAIEIRRYSALTNNVLPLLNKIKIELTKKVAVGEQQFKSKQQIDVAQNLIKLIAEISEQKTDLDGMMDTYYDQIADALIEEGLANTNISEEEKEVERQKIKGGLKDNSWLGSTFGIVSHSSNPLLQLLNEAAVRIETNVRNETKAAADDIIREIYDKKLAKHERSLIKKFSGNNTHYYLTFINWDAYDKAKEKIKIDLLVQFTGKAEADIVKLLEHRTAEEIIKNPQEVIKYRELLREAEKPLNEQMMKPSYELDREILFEKAGIAKDSPTRVVIKNKNQSSYHRNAKYRDKEGRLNKTLQSEADKLEDASAYQAHLSAKSAFDNLGNLREGLLRVKYADLTAEQKAMLPVQNLGDYKGEVTLLKPGKTKEDLDEDSLVALELANFDLVFLEKKATEGGVKGSPAKAFYDKVLEEELGTGSAFDFVSSNASFSIASEYYESLGQNKGFNEVAQEYISSIKVTDDKNTKQAILDHLKTMQQARKEILKQFKKIKNPTETDTVAMGGVMQARIRELDESIALKRRDLALPTEYYEKMSFGESQSVREVTSDFENALTHSGLDTYEFCLNHMSSSNRQKVTDFAREMEDYVRRKNDKKTVKKQYVEFTNRVRATGVLDGVVEPKEIVRIYKEVYAKENLASYFLKNTPAGFTEVQDALKSGQLKFSDVLDETKRKGLNLDAGYPGLKYLEINPDYAWTTMISDNDYSNPRYDQKGFRVQPNIDMFFDPEFESEFGITKQDFIDKGSDLHSHVPTKNKEKYELLKLLTDLRMQTNDKLGGDPESYNKWQRVQLGKTVAEKYLRTIGSSAGANVKNIFNDMLKSRIDEKEYGDVAYVDVDVNVKIIPKYFQAKMDSPEAVTENAIQAEIMNFQEAVRYQERVKAETDFDALLHKISNQKFLSNGGSVNKSRIRKKGELSAYYQQALEYKDAKIYGIRQSLHMETEILGKKVDLTQAINVIQGFTRFKNLAYNSLVDITSFTTGVIGNIMDRVAGDFYHKSSSNRAKGLMGKMLGKYTAESYKIDKRSSLHHFLEFFQIEDINSRIENTSFGMGARFAFKSHYAMAKLANLPVTPEVLMTILCDYRLVDGKFMSWTDFSAYKKSENKTLSTSAIESLWEQVKTSSIYDYLDISEKGITYNKKFEDLQGGKQLAREEFLKLQVRVVKKARQVIQGVDGTLNESDQVAAQRNSITNLLMMHKGWMAISLTRRFKQRHLNLSTGQYEEGHYTTLMKFLGDMILAKKNKREFSDVLANLTVDQKRNMKRTGVELGFGVFLLTLGSILFKDGDDDEEDPTYLGKLSELIFLRTVSEYNSTQFYSMHGSLIETLKSPIVAMRTVEDFSKLPGKSAEWVGGNGEDGDFLKYMTKLFITKRSQQMGSTEALQEQITAYKHFNSLTLLNLSNSKEQEYEE